ncbi:MAG: hypothetical protein B6U78_03080 [Candidatus Aenigmarchaeota archaeon ex4484_224]|nr:MAG: hypothetical protein B6U78_03080 [Candidatus Aenigmarchaeota archaeon ex4484_224]
MSLLKIDIDHKEPFDKWKKEWIETRKKILEFFGFKVEDIVIYESGSKRGYHIYIKIDKEIPDEEINKLQFLLGDDLTRVVINMRRIERGVGYWNVLFSKILRKRSDKEDLKKAINLIEKSNLNEYEKEWLKDYVEMLYRSIKKFTEVLK